MDQDGPKERYKPYGAIVPEGDRRAALWAAYMNCLNALRVTETIAEGGKMLAVPSVDLFEGCVKILQYSFLKEEKDADYDKAVKEAETHAQNDETATLREAFLIHNANTELFKRKRIFREGDTDLGFV